MLLANACLALYAGVLFRFGMYVHLAAGDNVPYLHFNVVGNAVSLLNCNLRAYVNVQLYKGVGSGGSHL